ncbi:MAG: hypothetical protein IKV11_02520, partial [Alphaproteobacteria bacterium]|nr:hypothetical protein [Alphaproteobacteria bacterium]
MSFDKLISILAENDEVGKNNPCTDMQITVANVKLRRNNIPNIPVDFAELLKKYNGLSCDGNTIFGVATETMFFPDLVDFNISIFEDEETASIVLGQDEDFYLIYDYIQKTYRIIDKFDFEERIRS